MKIISALLAAALFAPAAAARPAHVDCFDFDGGWELCHKPVGSSCVRVVVNNMYDLRGFIAVRNCATGSIKTRLVDDMSMSVIRDLTQIACK